MELLDDNMICEILLKVIDSSSIEKLISSIDNRARSNDKWNDVINRSTFLWKELYKRLDFVWANEFTAIDAYNHLKEKKYLRVVNIETSLDARPVYMSAWKDYLILVNSDSIDFFTSDNKFVRRMELASVYSQDNYLMLLRDQEIVIYIDNFENETIVKHDFDIRYTYSDITVTSIGILLCHKYEHEIYKIVDGKITLFREYPYTPIILYNGIYLKEPMTYYAFDGMISQISCFRISSSFFCFASGKFVVYKECCDYDFMVCDVEDNKIIMYSQGDGPYQRSNYLITEHGNNYLITRNGNIIDSKGRIYSTGMIFGKSVAITRSSTYPELIIFLGTIVQYL